MNTLTIFLEFALLIWFFGGLVTYRVRKIYLAEGMGIKRAEFGMFAVYFASIILRIALPNVGSVVVLFILFFWLAIQYFCHWHYTFWCKSGKD